MILSQTLSLAIAKIQGDREEGLQCHGSRWIGAALGTSSFVSDEDDAAIPFLLIDGRLHAGFHCLLKSFDNSPIFLSEHFSLMALRSRFPQLALPAATPYSPPGTASRPTLVKAVVDEADNLSPPTVNVISTIPNCRVETCNP